MSQKRQTIIDNSHDMDDLLMQKHLVVLIV